MISDGRGLGAPLDYTISSCSSHATKLDLLTHGILDTAKITALEDQIRKARLDYNQIQLGKDVIQDIIDYICDHPSLIFLVAMPDDAIAKTLINEVLPRFKGRFPVPLVLVDNELSALPIQQPAA